MHLKRPSRGVPRTQSYMYKPLYPKAKGEEGKHTAGARECEAG